MRSILHLSDVHFGPKHAPAAAEAAIELAAERRPDLVVVSGDLTQRAKPAQFRAARAWVERFQRPWIAIPGNHDVPLYRVWERALLPFGAYRRHFDRALEPVFEDAELAVVSINSAFPWTVKDGRFLWRRLEELARRLAAAPAGRCRIVVTHHELVPAPAWDMRVARNADLAVEILARSGVDLVLAGHRHESYLAFSAPEAPATGVRPFPIFHVGTSTSLRGRGGEKGRNSLNWIEIDRQSMLLETLLFDPAASAFVVASARRLPRRGE